MQIVSMGPQSQNKIQPQTSKRISGNIEILFEDQHLLVLDKPVGLLSQGDSSGDLCLVTYLQEYLKRNYVGLIHRLDRNTSGLMIVAKRSKSAQRLTDSLQNGEIKRSYLAWLVGELKTPVKWTHYLEKNSDTNKVRVVRNHSSAEARKLPVPEQKGKIAILSAVPLKTTFWKSHLCTLAEITLETGRSHQIRVQAAFEKYPVLGDRKYGANLGYPGLALYSFFLEFPHPMSGEKMTFSKEPIWINDPIAKSTLSGT